MINRVNISLLRPALALATGLLLPLLGSWSGLGQGPMYLLFHLGLAVWLYGIQHGLRHDGVHVRNTALIAIGLGVLYPLWTEGLARYDTAFSDYFQVVFKWGSWHAVSWMMMQWLLFWGVLHVYRHDLSKPLQLSGKDKRILVVLGYVTFFVMAVYFTNLLQGLLGDIAFRFDLTDINSYGWAHALFYAHIAIALTTLFIAGQKVTSIIQSLLPEIRHRIPMLLLAALLWLPVSWLLHRSISVLMVSHLAVLIFAIAMDLFAEKPGNGYVWFIIWLLFLSSTASATLLYTMDKLHTHKEIAELKQDKKGLTLPHYALTSNKKILKAKGLFRHWQESETMVVRDQFTFGRYTIKRKELRGGTLFWAYPSPSITNGISLFSLFFIFSLCVLVLTGILNSIIPLLPDNIPLRFRLKSSLQERIQIIIISTIIVSFVIIGYTSVYFFKQRSINALNTTILHELEYIHQLLKEHPSVATTPAWRRSYVLPLGYNLRIISAEEAKEKYADVMKSLAKQNKGLSPLQGEENAQVIRGAIAKVKGNQYYLILKRRAPSTFAPPGILTNLINVYVFLFLIAFSVVLTLASSISWPLKVLGDKLKTIRLNQKNEKLKWSDNDEIGQLINNYNEMLAKLQESAELLAKTERDTAWREMAKQVAHEIKNPLTPMKLSIQYLINTAKANPEALPEMVQKVSKTMIEQIDNLSSIATEFSNFAKMPIAKNGKIALNDVVVSVHNLFRKREDMLIRCYLPIDDIYVFADREQLLRVLNNLIKNAVQSIPMGRQGDITIKLQKKSDLAVISIEDNGVGIPDNMRAKIFDPNFTTKSSGTGLGLAMCRNMIEGFNGKIHFVSEENKGTTFFVEIPLMRLEDNYKENNKIILT